MAQFDYKWAKGEIAQINAIVETCPEAVREKCFELLFATVFNVGATALQRGAEAAPSEPPVPRQEKTADEQNEKTTQQVRQEKKLPPNVLAFARRTGVTAEDIEKLFILDHEPMLPIYKIPTVQMSQAQLYKVMMILLENGLLVNQLSARYAELRDSVKEDGLFDSNFNKTLKRNHELFKGAVTKDAIKEGEVVELTGAGLSRLASIVKELGQ